MIPNFSNSGTGDFTIDEKAKSATLTEEGVLKVEKLLKVDNLTRRRVWAGMGDKARARLRPFLEHPEARLHGDAGRVVAELYPA